MRKPLYDIAYGFEFNPIFFLFVLPWFIFTYSDQIMLAFSFLFRLRKLHTYVIHYVSMEAFE